jgi:hypothetical protein
MLLLASLSVSVITELAPDDIDEAETPTLVCVKETAPGFTVTVGLPEVTNEPPTVARILVAVPATRALKVDEYVPLLLSTVAAMFPVEVPPICEKTTARPPVLNWFPAASFAVRVRLTVAPDATVPLDTEMIEFAKEIAPGVTVMVGIVLVTTDPPAVT